MGNYTKPMQKK